MNSPSKSSLIFEPKIKHRDSTRPVMVVQPAEVPREPEKAKLGENHLRSGGKNLSNDEMSTPLEKAAVEVEIVKMHQVSCLVDDAVMQLLDRCKELSSGKYPCGMDLNTLLMELATTWLDKNDPTRRSERREKRNKSGEPRRKGHGET